MPLIIAILAFFISLIQSTVVPAFKLYNSFPDLVLPVVLIILFFGSRKLSGVFIITSSIFMSIFSGVAMIYFILPYFLVFITYVFLNERRIISRPSVTLALFVFFVANLIKMIIQSLMMNDLAPDIAFIYCSLISAVWGVFFYYLCRRIYFLLNPQILRDRIKISHL